MINTVKSPTTDWTDKEWTMFSDWLQGMLRTTDVEVTFTKKDGTERVMRCTLDPAKLPKVEIKEDKASRKKSDTSIAVYDLEAAGWRSFVVKSIKRIACVIE